MTPLGFEVDEVGVIHYPADALEKGVAIERRHVEPQASVGSPLEVLEEGLKRRTLARMILFPKHGTDRSFEPGGGYCKPLAHTYTAISRCGQGKVRCKIHTSSRPMP